jgi:uncharacterized protein YkwD
MKSLTLLLFMLSPVLASAQEVCVGEEEQKLYDLIMQYRKTKKLKSISFSAALTKVAQAHVRDLAENYVFQEGNECNPHSWSAKGNWSSCCYTNDHKEARCMWSKPQEIAGYAGNGYEIAYFSSAGANAVEGIEGWKKSPGHNPVIVNLGTWAKVEWKAIGVGIYKEYGVVWFGEMEDEARPQQCK